MPDKITCEVGVTLLPHAQHLELPKYATEQAAGMDLQAAIAEPIVLQPGKRVIVPTGITIALPVGYEAQIRPRSGLAAKHGLTVLNTPGTIDADYRGEIKAILINLGDKPYVIEPETRIAQMVIAAHERVTWKIFNTLPETLRGIGGFGSTGTKC